MGTDYWRKFDDNSPDYFEIEGVASSSSEDSFGEIINQKGIDLSFVRDQLVTINIEHGDGFPVSEMAVVGVLTDARVVDDGLWVKGRVYKDHLYASAIHRELTKKGGSLQLSIEMGDCVYGEGRFSNTIVSGVLTSVALTKNPANDDTYAKISKSHSDPALERLTIELRRLNGIVESCIQRKQRRKTIIVKALSVRE